MKPVTIYTDGACSDNQKPRNRGGWGVVLQYEEKRVKLSGGELNTTNNRMELTACIKALEELGPGGYANLYSDSAYLVNCMKQKWYVNWQRNGWLNAKKQPVENQDLWERILTLLKDRNIQFHKVKGHSGVELNELADQLANKGMDDQADDRQNSSSEDQVIAGVEGCSWRKIGEKYLVRLDRGVKVKETLEELLQSLEITGGTISGIGAMQAVEIAYYDLDQQRYDVNTYPDIYEVLSFMGNISVKNNKHFVHAHVVLGGADFQTIGGHFMDGVVAITMELTISDFGEKVSRRLNADTGLDLLDF